MKGVSNLSFPTINIDQPYGSNSVSTIDDCERETRRWLRDCIMQISGYPNCSSIKIDKWTTEGRPVRPIQGVVGYNSTLNALERYSGSQWESVGVANAQNADVADKATNDLDGNEISSSYVKLNGSTMTGTLNQKMSSIQRGTSPSSQQSLSPYRITDNDGEQLSRITKVVKIDGASETRLYDYGNTNGSADYISIGHDGNGNAITYAPTPSVDDSSHKIATTQFVNNFINSGLDINSSDNGYLKIKDTLIIQWGTVTPSSTGEITVQFPTRFSTKCYTVIPNKKSSDNGNVSAYSFTKSSFKVTAPSTSSINWIAIGE